MAQKQKKTAQSGKNSSPVRRPAKSKGKPAARKAAKTEKVEAPAPAGKGFPIDWFFFHPEDYSVRQLREALSVFPGLDIEIWPELGVLEAAFPGETFVDFEPVGELPPEPELQAFLTAHPCKSAYYVSVEPACREAELAFLREAAARTGGIFAADTDGLSPAFGI